MRRFALILTTQILTGLIPSVTQAQELTGTDWQLLAIDGVVLDLSVTATLQIEDDGRIGGKAPCNSWSVQNAAELPKLALKGIRATRMACDQLAEEQAFFDALGGMTEATLTAARTLGTRNLVLTGPDGRRMEFVTDRMNSLTICTTCE
jgi:heat shock protein HslJ